MKTVINHTTKLVTAAALTMLLLIPLSSSADVLIGSFNTGTSFDGGGCFSRTFNRGIGVGYRSANVQLSGWSLQYVSSDHHIRRASVRITGVNYNRFTGNVAFTVSGCYYDQNADDDFYWNADYTIEALT